MRGLLKRLTKLVSLSLLGAILFFVAGLAQAPQRLETCDLIRNPVDWDRKIVTVQGHVRIANGDFAVLVPSSMPYCRYPNSKFSSSEESAEILLEWPDTHFLSALPTGFVASRSNLSRAYERITEIRKSHPKTNAVVVTLRGYVQARQYRIDSIPRQGQGRPQHVPNPLTIIVESYLSIEHIP